MVHFISPENIRKQPEACNFIKKETLAQVFSCEFCEIFKNTFLTEHLRRVAPVRRYKNGSLA